MSYTEILLTISLMSCVAGILGMLRIFSNMAISLSMLSVCLHEMVIKNGVVKHGAGVQGMAEDTKVAE